MSLMKTKEKDLIVQMIVSAKSNLDWVFDLLFFTMWLIYKACKLYRPTKQSIKIKTNFELVSHLSQALSSLFTFSLNSNGLLNVIFSSVCSDYLL